MDDNHKSAPVTRREFYAALVLLWIYISVVIGDLLRIEWRLSTCILELSSIAMIFAYLMTGFGRRRPSGADGRSLAPPSDRVKEIARDPARKIEAIRIYREETGAGLAKAKEAVEAYINSM